MIELLDHIAACQRLYTLLLSPVWQAYGLTYMELTVLLFLANNPGYDTATDLVERRRLSKSHVSAAVRTLTERGLLAGERRPENRRSVHLSLCPAAAEVVSAGQAAQAQFLSILSAGFSPEDKLLLERLIQRTGENVAACLRPMKGA